MIKLPETTVKQVLQFLDKTLFSLFLIFGFVFLNYLLYIRVIKLRLPKEISKDLFTSSEFISLGMFLMLLVISGYFIIVNIRKILEKEGAFQKRWFMKPLSWVSNFFKKSYFAVDHVIKEVIFYDYIGEILTSLGYYLYRNFYDKQIYLLSVFYIFPRIFVISMLFVDVFYFKTFNYVYKFSFLLLIPLLADYVIYSLNKFWQDNAKIFGELLNFFHYETGQPILVTELVLAHLGSSRYKHLLDDNALVSSLSPKFLEEHPNEAFNSEVTLQELLDNFNEIVIPSALFECKFSLFYKRKFLPYFLVILHSLYVLIWSYVLYYSW